MVTRSEPIKEEEITFERMEEVTRRVLGVTEKAPGVWHEICLVMLAITKSHHPEETEEEKILLLTEIAILEKYMVQEVSSP